MKKLFLTLIMTVIATAMLQAQQISVVSSGGTTKLYNTLADAINGAAPGSVIYLPGGGFSIDDSVKITKKLTIVGIGHKSNNENVDGVTTISGNLWFNEGSSGSAVLACYITGNVNIGNDGSSVNDVLIRYCNVNQIRGYYNKCLGTVVNQNYIRQGILGYQTFISAEITNNVISYVMHIDGGVISNNVITTGDKTYNSLRSIKNSVITDNIILPVSYTNSYLTDNIISRNMGFASITSFGDDYIDLSGVDKNNVFINYNNGDISPTSDFHFKDAYQQYENQVGIYSGTGFNDDQLAPVPYIVGKRVDEQTDAQGKLNVKIRVKAAQ